MFELFLGSKHPIYRVKPKKQLFGSGGRFHGRLDGHYQIIKRINPLILSRDLNPTNL